MSPRHLNKVGEFLGVPAANQSRFGQGVTAIRRMSRETKPAQHAARPILTTHAMGLMCRSVDRVDAIGDVVSVSPDRRGKEQCGGRCHTTRNWSSGTPM